MEIHDFFKIMVEKDASDLYLTVARPPMYRIEGVIHTVGEQKFSPVELENLARAIMSDEQWSEFCEKKEMNLALSLPNITRFRVNFFRQRGSVGLVVRKIKVEIPSIDELGLSPIVKEISMLKRGLVLVVGATGVGKSTTLAAMIDYRNSTQPGHIISVEDPIEFVHRHKKSIVSQRELGLDTNSFQNALANAMRQAPDVVFIGEIRHPDTMETAMTFADTGHLCLCTLHSTNANQALERILNFFPPIRHSQLLLELSLNLRAIIAQRLITPLNGPRVAAIEVLVDTPRIKDLIKKGEVDSIKEAMEQGIQEGCQTFDQALFLLYKEGKISIEEALANADSANNLRLKIKLDGFGGDQAIEKPAGEPRKAREANGLAREPLKSVGSPFRFRRS